MAQNLVLVAGYPKSGTTWVRYVFEVLRRRGSRAVSINDMEGGYYGARRRVLFDELAPVNAGDLLPHEIDEALPHIFRGLAEREGGPHIVKVHDRPRIAGSGTSLFPPENVRVAIYLTRHPFDVAVSSAHHLGITVNEVIAIMRRDEVTRRAPLRLPLYLNEQWGSWSGNVNAWLDLAPYSVLAVRYEDIFANPGAVFAQLARAAGIRGSDTEVSRACEFARFQRLRDEERSAGFFERPRTSPAFFRAGKPLSWEGILDDSSRAQLTADHGQVMARLGYQSDGTATAVAIA